MLSHGIFQNVRQASSKPLITIDQDESHLDQFLIGINKWIPPQEKIALLPKT